MADVRFFPPGWEARLYVRQGCLTLRRRRHVCYDSWCVGHCGHLAAPPESPHPWAAKRIYSVQGPDIVIGVFTLDLVPARPPNPQRPILPPTSACPEAIDLQAIHVQCLEARRPASAGKNHVVPISRPMAVQFKQRRCEGLGLIGRRLDAAFTHRNFTLAEHLKHLPRNHASNGDQHNGERNINPFPHGESVTYSPAKIEKSRVTGAHHYLAAVASRAGAAHHAFRLPLQGGGGPAPGLGFCAGAHKTLVPSVSNGGFGWVNMPKDGR